MKLIIEVPVEEDYDSLDVVVSPVAACCHCHCHTSATALMPTDEMPQDENRSTNTLALFYYQSEKSKIFSTR